MGPNSLAVVYVDPLGEATFSFVDGLRGGEAKGLVVEFSSLGNETKWRRV